MPVLQTKTCNSCGKKTKRTKNWKICRNCEKWVCVENENCCRLCWKCEKPTCQDCRKFIFQKQLHMVCNFMYQNIPARSGYSTRKLYVTNKTPIFIYDFPIKKPRNRNFYILCFFETVHI
jgi:hypothetical protein